MGMLKGHPAPNVLDSSAKIPTGLFKGNSKFFGLYDECLEVVSPNKDFTGKHCMVRVVDERATYIQKYDLNKKNIKKFIYGYQRYPEGYNNLKDYYFAICLPSTCSVQKIQSGLRKVIQLTSQRTFVELLERDCNTKDSGKMTKSGWIFVYILLGFLSIAAFSTAYDLYYRTSAEQGKFHILLTSFSIYTNGKSLFAYSDISGDLKALYGIRGLSIIWILFAHSSLFTGLGPAINFFDTVDYFRDARFVPVINSFLAVETFLFLSGFFTWFLFYRSISNLGYFDFPVEFVRRYIRRTPPFAAILLIQLYIFPYIGNGPMWNAIALEASKTCSNFVLPAMTYTQNYASSVSACLSHTWFLSIEMQLFVLAPFVMYLLHYKPKMGCVIILASIFASSIWSSIVTYVNGFAPTMLTTSSMDEQMKREYVRVETRASSWLIGLATCYFIHCVDEKKIHVKFSKLVVAIGWLVCAGVGLGSLYSTLLFQDFDYTPMKSALYVPLHRLAWSLCLSWIVIACRYGVAGPVNKILSINFFQIISRLSYNIYLIHFPLLLYRMGSQRTNYYINTYTSIYTFCGDLMFTFLFAIPFKLIFEMPFCILANIILKDVRIIPVPWRKKGVDGVEEDKKEKQH